MRRRVDALYQEIDQLFRRTLTGGSNSKKRLDAVSELRSRGSRLVFEKAKSWTTSSHPRRRQTAAQVLSQLRSYTRRHSDGASTQTFVLEGFELLARMLRHESDQEAQLAIIYGFGHLSVPEAARLVVPFADHENVDFRHATAFTLGSFHEDFAARDALQKLMEDPDPAVRDWAIFGIGTLGNADSEELRLAFIAHLNDPYFDAKLESAEALAKRQDLRVVRPLIKMLERYGAINSLISAACALLHMEADPPRWFAKEYIEALETAFSKQTPTPAVVTSPDSAT